MNLIIILKELWRRRILTVLAVAAAAAVSLLAVYQVGVSPPSISQRAEVTGKGSIAILVDSAKSPIADSQRDLTGLAARAGVFARLMAGGNVVRQIAEDAGVPFDQIAVAGPTPLPGEAPGAAETSTPLPYGISFTQSGELPIVGIETQAPTVEKARALAAAAPAAVRSVVTSVQAQQQTPEAKRIEFRTLGPAQAEQVDDVLGKKVALGLFLFVLGLLLLLIVGWPRFVAAWRSADPEDLGYEEPSLPEETPGVVHLPAGRTGEPEPDANWAEQRREP